MHFTRFTDNALRCLLYLGERPGTIATVADIATRMSMSEDHLTKVVQRLAQHGYVQTIRGRRGGVRLALRPEDITIGAVVRATEDDCALVPCFQARESCPVSSTCRLPGLLDQALAAFFAVLDAQKLADLINPTSTSPATSSVTSSSKQ